MGPLLDVVLDGPVCVWDDDNLQFERPNLRGGANRVSLNEARRNFRRHGASERGRRSLARLPRPDEKPFRYPDKDGSEIFPETAMTLLPVRSMLRELIIPRANLVPHSSPITLRNSGKHWDGLGTNIAGQGACRPNSPSHRNGPEGLRTAEAGGSNPLTSTN